MTFVLRKILTWSGDIVGSRNELFEVIIVNSYTLDPKLGLEKLVMALAY